MCSVRHSPMPRAPKANATLASRGTSALARIPSRRISSAQPSSFSNLRYRDDFSALRVPFTTCSTSDGLVGSSCRMTSPVEPSIEMASPSSSVRPATLSVLPFASMCREPAPTTDGLPIWRPTTAACEVMPPVAVRMPWATLIPWISSGTVSMRTSTTRLPLAACATASSAVNTTAPVAAPGEAGSPLAAMAALARALRSKIGCRS